MDPRAKLMYAPTRRRWWAHKGESHREREQEDGKTGRYKKLKPFPSSRLPCIFSDPPRWCSRASPSAVHGSLPVEERAHVGGRARPIFLHGDMAEPLVDVHAGAGDVRPESPRIGDGDERVLVSPQDERRERGAYEGGPSGPRTVPTSRRRTPRGSGSQRELVAALDELRCRRASGPRNRREVLSTSRRGRGAPESAKRAAGRGERRAVARSSAGSRPGRPG